MGVFRRFIDAVGILNGHPGLWTKIYWGDDGKTLHTECGCAWEARGGRLLSLPAAGTGTDTGTDSSGDGDGDGSPPVETQGKHADTIII